jgi:hypothetical protein
MKEMNQNRPPLPKKKRVDVQGNDKRRVFVKSGNATMMLAKGLNKNACDILESKIVNAIKDLGGECTCSFLKFK